jgi:hypothetical protein
MARCGRAGVVGQVREWQGLACSGMAGMDKGGISMIYQWKQNRFPVEAQKAGEELERIKQQYGGIVPKIIVNESRPENTILHNCFDWNDETAAEAYREVQAREIVRSIVVVKTAGEEEQKTITVRAFVPVSAEEEQPKKYITIDEAMADDEFRRQIIQQALKELISYKAKYGYLKELSEIFEAIEKLTA